MEELIHKGKNILFFDIETVGFPRRGEPIGIIEVGMQYVPNLGFSKDVTTISQLYSFNGIIPYEITKITGITNEMVQNKPHISECFNLIQSLINESEVVVAHNAPFDIRCLELAGFDFTGKEVFDTKTHAKRMFPELSSHTMDSVCEHLGVNNKNAHRAISDVNAMIEMYSKMTDLNKERTKLEYLIEKHKKLSYTKTKKAQQAS